MSNFITFQILSLVPLLFQLHVEGYWFMPERFSVQNGESISVEAQTGENFINDGYAPNVTVSQIQHYTPSGGKRRILQQVPFQLELTESGSHVVTIETEKEFVDYEPGSFESLLREYDLSDVQYARQQSRQQDSPTTVLKTTYHKIYITSGNMVPGLTDKPLGLPLEIVANKNPTTLKRGEPIEFKVLHQQKPVFGARVKIWNRNQNRTTLQHIYTEQNGTIRTHISTGGIWMVAVMIMEADRENNGWKSKYSTFMFAVQ